MSENWKDCHSCLYSLQILTSAFVHPDCFSLVIVSSFLFSEFAQKRETMTERPWSEAAKTSCPLPLKLFLLLSAFLTLCRAEDDLESLLQDDSRLQRRKHHHDWDHLTLTQQWPPTACIAAAGHHRCVSNRMLCIACDGFALYWFFHSLSSLSFRERFYSLIQWLIALNFFAFEYLQVSTHKLIINK